MDHGSKIMEHGSRINNLGPWTLFWHERPFQKGSGRDIKTIQIYDQRSIILNRFYKDRIKDPGSWTLFWHERPFQKGSGRDIKTARIYNPRPIILYRFRNIQDLGPCFSMNGHFRRDPDVISRPLESTIDVLSFYIGFGSLSRVTMVVFDKHKGFV